MIYKLKEGFDVIYFGHISHEAYDSSINMAMDLDMSFDPNDALYSFHNIPLLMLRYNNCEENHDWYIKTDEDDEFYFDFIENIPNDEWYSWKQVSWVIDKKGFTPYSQDSFLFCLDKDEMIEFNRLGIRSI